MHLRTQVRKTIATGNLTPYVLMGSKSMCLHVNWIKLLLVAGS